MTEAQPVHRVLCTAFEPSGDRLSAPVIEALLARRPDVEVHAWGGPAMEAAGAIMHGHSAQDGAMGLGALAHVRSVRATVHAMGDWMRDNRPSLLMPIDSQAANIHVCKRARRLGVRIAHLAAPQMWAWGSWRAGTLRRNTDHLLCLWPFEPAWFARRGIEGTFVGHPAINRPIDDAALDAAAAALPAGESKLLLLPGSRSQEIARNMPVMRAVLDRLRRDRGDLQAVCVAATQRVETLLEDHDMDGIEVLSGDMLDTAVRWCDLALACSGTVTLNLLRQCCPMVGIYPTGVISRLGAPFVLRAPHRLLPNIIAAARIVPELVPCSPNPAPIAEAVGRLLDDPRKLADQRAALQSTLDKFDSPGFAESCVDVLCGLLDAPQR